MSHPIKLPGLGLPPIPNDKVHLEVEADLGRCTPGGPSAAKLQNIAASGMDISISQLVAYSGMHFEGAVPGNSALGLEREKIRSAWTMLKDWNPRAVLRRKDGVPKLVLDDRPNPNIKRWISELLGVGAGLTLAKAVFGRPYRFWHPNGHGVMDYVTHGSSGGQLRVEVRGRFNRQGMKAARNDIVRKIKPGSSFENEAGIIFCPRSTPNTRAPDFFVMDPPGKGTPAGPHAQHRSLLRHYAPFFELQGLADVAARLRTIARFNEKAFMAFLREGDPEIARMVWKRTSFFIAGKRFAGTVWSEVPIPFFRPPESEETGYFFWGIDVEVAQCLAEGDLDRVIEMPVDEQYGELGDGRLFLLDDATVLTWFGSMREVLDHP